MKDKVYQGIGVSVVAALMSLLAINSYVYTKDSGNKLEAKVIRMETLRALENRLIHQKLDKLKDLLVEFNRCN